MTTFEVSGQVKRFPGQHGWYYVELNAERSADLRPMVAGVWPALLRAGFSLRTTTWQSSIMPIKNGPLFIALPAKVRTAEKIEEGQTVTIQVELKI